MSQNEDLQFSFHVDFWLRTTCFVISTLGDGVMGSQARGRLLANSIIDMTRVRTITTPQTPQHQTRLSITP